MCSCWERLTVSEADLWTPAPVKWFEMPSFHVLLGLLGLKLFVPWQVEAA